MNSQEIIEAIKTILRMQAQNESNITLNFFEDKRESVLTILRMMQPALTTIDDGTINGYYETAVKEYKSVYPVDIDPSSSLTKKGFQTWLTEERKKQLQEDYIN